jgi:hypothetical protein
MPTYRSTSVPVALGAHHGTADALETISWMIDPAEPAIAALIFDDDRTPMHATVITDTPSPDSIHDVADVLERSLTQQPHLGALVLVSVRPAQPCEPLDFDRLLDLTARFDAIGLELIDWYIWSGSVRTSMRSAAGLPSRW